MLTEITRKISKLFFQIDTNSINARKNLPNMNQLEKWCKDEIINILMSKPAVDEVKRGSGGHLRSQKASEYIFSFMEDNLAGNEKQIFKKIQGILFPSGIANDNQENDVKILLHCWNIGAMLITNDGDSKTQPGGILGHAMELQSLGIMVMNDTAAVKLVADAIRERDKLAREYSSMTGKSLPVWVGQD